MICVNVLGIQYSIEIISASELIKQLKETNLSFLEIIEVIGQEGEHFAGLCDNMECKIWINRDIRNKEKLKKVLIHEIMEAIDGECLLGIEHSKLQAITNGLFMSNLFNIDELVERLLNEPQPATA